MTKDWFFNRASDDDLGRCASESSSKSIELEEGECIDSATVWTKAGTTYSYVEYSGEIPVYTTAGPGSSTVEAMTYTTSKGRTRTWGSTSGITTDTRDFSSYTKETTFFSKGLAESGSWDLSDYWWVPMKCIDVEGGFESYRPSDENGFCDNEGFTSYVDGSNAIFFNDEGCTGTNY